MGHDHDHSHPHTHSGDASLSALRLALGLTFGVALVQAAGGVLSNSLALISDSAHMAMDCVVLALALGVQVFLTRSKPKGSRYTYGYVRLEALGGLFSSILAWAVSAGILWEAWERVQAPPEVRGELALGFACLGLAANWISLRKLHSAHSHDGDNLNLEGATLHVIADLAGSVATIVAALMVWLGGWNWADPAISGLAALLIALSGFGLFRKCVLVLMEGAPERLELDQLEARILELSGVQSMHDLHVWSLGRGRVALSAHLKVAHTGVSQDVLRRAQVLLREEFHIEHSTLQVEAQDAAASGLDCEDCE